MSAAACDSTVPASGAINPQTSSSSVVLPQPLGPTTATISPERTRSETSSRAVTRRRAAARRREALGHAIQAHGIGVDLSRRRL